MKKLNKNEVFVGCGLGQHPEGTKFNAGCNACLHASIDRLVDILNKEIDQDNKKK
jgi:hypothetical protein